MSKSSNMRKATDLISAWLTCLLDFPYKTKVENEITFFSFHFRSSDEDGLKSLLVWKEVLQTSTFEEE